MATASGLSCLDVFGGHMCLLNRGHGGPHECLDECYATWGDDDDDEGER